MSPYGHTLDSGKLSLEHLTGVKDYELTNQLGNVQAVISDNNYEKDINGDLLKDETKTAIRTAYDYYPFGMLMMGRSQPFRTPICITHNGLFTYSSSNWINLGIDAYNVSASPATVTQTAPTLSTPSSSVGVEVTGTNGGFGLPFTVNVLRPTDVKVYISSLIGYVNVEVNEVWGGSHYNFLGSNNTNYTSYSTGPLTVRVSPNTTNLTLFVSLLGSALSTSQSMFVVDSIVVEDPTYIQTGGMYTTCIDSMNVNDKYEFGFNGQLKINEIAGMGNHNTALFWEYDTRLGRRWNLDPKPHIGTSDYSVFGGNPIFNADPSGDYFTESEGSNGLKRLDMYKAKASNKIEKYKNELAHIKPNSKRAEHLRSLIEKTQSGLDKVAEMEKSNIEFHIGAGKDAKAETSWNPEKRRVEVGSLGVGANGKDDLGAFPHELEHGYQFLSGDLSGYFGSPADPLYDLTDEYNAAWYSTLLADEKDFSNWHSDAKGRTYDEYKMTETGPNSGHGNLRNRTTAISVNTSATVLLGLKDNILSASAYQALKANPKATVLDAINYFNNYKKAHGSSDRILVGKALENR
jgi:hypothetical protein